MTDMKNEDHPKNLLVLIDNAEFPTSKASLIETAEENGGTESAIEMFRALPHEEYETLKDVNADLGLINKEPGQQNMFASKSANYDEKVRTTCSYCGVGCNLEASVKNGKVVSIDTPKETEVNAGHTCLKGRYAFGFYDHKDRLRSPLIKKNGKFEKASWDEAYGYIKNKLEKITKEIKIQQTTSYSNVLNSSNINNSWSSSNGREGFIIGFSYGRQSTEIERSITSNYYSNNFNASSSASFDDEGTATDFKIGFAPSSSVAIYYTNKVSWYDDDVALRNTGFGATFFLNTSNNGNWKPSAFISASIGSAELSYDGYNDYYIDSYLEDFDGSGYTFGVGVEPAKNLMIDMVWSFALLESSSSMYDWDYGYDLEFDISVFSITIGLMSL